MNYSKFALGLIKNWLLKNGCTLSNEASTSESVYLKYGETRIRISCHMPSCMSPNSIYIMIPVNDKHSFGIFVGKQYCVTSSLKELKHFLHSLFLVLDVKVFNELSKQKLDNSQLKQDFNNKTSEIVKLKAEISSLKQSNADLKQLNNEQKQKIDRQRVDLGILHTKLASMKK